MRIDFSDQVLLVADQIKPILAGQGSPIQSAILAELTAIWLAGHIIPDDPEETRRLRAELLDGHVRLIRQLIEANAELRKAAE